MKFVSAKVVEKPKIEIPIVEKMDIESKSKRQKESRYLRVKEDLKRSIFVIIVVFMGTQDQIASSFILSKWLILNMLKEMKEEYQEKSKQRKKMVVNYWRCHGNA